MNVNGSATGHASGDEIIITSPRGEELEYAIRFGFKATNNEVAYGALVNGLKIAHKLGASKIRVRSYSKLIVDQVLGEYKAREERMAEHLQVVQVLTTMFDVFSIEHVPREQNDRANSLA